MGWFRSFVYVILGVLVWWKLTWRNNSSVVTSSIPKKQAKLSDPSEASSGSEWEQWDKGDSIHNRMHFNKKQATVMDLVANYVHQHSASALQKESTAAQRHDKASRRRFVKGTYSCPYQAGNRLSHFLNAFAFAIVTNRTLLWHYCSEAFCPMSGTLSGCEQVLHRALWIPPLQQYFSWWNRKPKFLFGVSRPTSQDVFSHPLPLDIVPDKLVDFGIMERHDIHQGAAMLATSEAQQVLGEQAFLRAKHLFAAGISFAYGALFHAAFRIRPEMDQNNHTTRRDEISIAIHSRHTQEDNDGSTTMLEEMCVDKAIQSVRKKRGNITLCSIAIMADRNATLWKLADKALELGCQAHIASHDQGTSFSTEHGVFAGAGLFQDLALVRRAGDAAIKTFGSTSSDLMAALVSFHRTEAPMPRSPLVICCLLRDSNQCICQDDGSSPSEDLCV